MCAPTFKLIFKNSYLYIKENSSWQRRKLLHHVICQFKNRLLMKLKKS